ncbi:MAG: tyrosine-type recombinase/integrase [Dehalococcoidales bacterium]|nr:MAG: tyrosine-type recombinase/integrase [Dehalococcoidales bacterium]
MDWGLLSRNPVDRKAPKAVSKIPEIMNEKEVRAFLDAARETDFCALFYLFIYTGCRRSELLAVRWSDYDSQHGTISIQRTLHRLHNSKTIEQPTETKMSKRLITLP